MADRFVIPGDYLGTTEQYLPGENVYCKDESIISSTSGCVTIKNNIGRNSISVFKAIKNSQEKTFTPVSIGNLVLCKVKSINDLQCKVILRYNKKVDIICVNGKPLIVPYKGTIHVEDIRSTFNKDFTKPIHSFRLYDIVLGRVIGIFDNRNVKERIVYHITTAEKELGVVLAKSKYDDQTFLIPMSWKEMICPISHQIENRKVAKVIIDEDS